MNNDLRLIVEVKNFIFTLDEILVYFPKGEKVLKDSIYKTSYEVLKQITYANMLKDKESLQKEIVTNLSMLDFYFEFAYKKNANGTIKMSFLGKIICVGKTIFLY